MMLYIRVRRRCAACAVCMSAVFFLSCSSVSPASSVRKAYSAPSAIADLGAEYYLLADLYAELGKHDKAVELYKKAAATGIKSDTELRFKIARNSALAKNWDEALKEYQALAKLDDKNLILKKSIAWIYGQKGDLLKAETLYAALYAEYPYDKDICVNYILVSAALDKTEQAKEVLLAYTKQYPGESGIADLEKAINKEKVSASGGGQNELRSAGERQSVPARALNN